MQTSIFIARLIGPVMIVAGLAVLLNRQGFRTMAEDFLANRGLMFLCMDGAPGFPSHRQKP